MQNLTRRVMFNDGFNSLVHVTLGYLSSSCDMILPIFIAYQFFEKNQENTFIDVGEFIFGMFLEKVTTIKP